MSAQWHQFNKWKEAYESSTGDRLNGASKAHRNTKHPMDVQI